MSETFAARLKRLREERGLKQRELGALADMSPERISKYESGQNPEPRGTTLARLARGLKVPLSELRGADNGTRRTAPAAVEPLLAKLRSVWGHRSAESQKRIENELRRLIREEEG